MTDNKALVIYRKWCDVLSPEQKTELINKYSLTPDMELVLSSVRQMHIGKGFKLLEKIIEAEGSDITSVNLNNTMRYIWAADNCQKYRLNMRFARDDNNIDELIKMYEK